MTNDQGAVLPTDPGAFRLNEAGAIISSRTIDGFESGDLSSYQGATNRFDATTARASSGSYSLEARAGNSETLSIISRPGDGLEYYPQRGDTISFDFNIGRVGDVARFGFFHGGRSILQDSYELHFDVDGGQMTLYNDPGPNSSLDRLCSREIPIDTDEWNEVIIETGDILKVRYRGKTMTTSNQARDSGGILFSVTDIQTFWDNLTAV